MWASMPSTSASMCVTKAPAWARSSATSTVALPLQCCLNLAQSCSTVAKRARTVSSQGTNKGRSGSPPRSNARLSSKLAICWRKLGSSAVASDSDRR